MSRKNKQPANLDDAEQRRRFAEELIKRGDRWGELLALENAGETAKAAKLFTRLRPDLLDRIPPKFFTWQRGFIDAVVLDKNQATKAVDLLTKIFALRTIVMLRSLRLRFPITAELVQVISTHAPSSLRTLHLNVVRYEHLEALALPQLEALTIYFAWPPTRYLPKLFANRKLPALRTLEMYASSSPGNELEPAMLDALVKSPLFRQLTKLDLHHGAIDKEGITRLKAAKSHQLELALREWE